MKPGVVVHLLEQRGLLLVWLDSDLSPIESVWHFTKRKIGQWRPQTADQRKTFIQREWAYVPLTTQQQLVVLSPQRLKCKVFKGKDDVTRW